MPGPPALLVSRLAWAPGLRRGQAPEGRRVLTPGPIRPWREDGWMGWGAGQCQASRRGTGKDLVLWAWLSAGRRGRAAGERPGAGLSPEWAREEAEAVPEALAAMGGGVWEGDAPPSSQRPAEEEARPCSRKSEGKHGSSWAHPCVCCSHRRCGQTDPVSSLEASVGGGGCQGEGSWPTCWEAHTEEEIGSLMGSCDPRGMWLPFGLPGARGDIVPLLGSSVSAGA